MTSVCVGSGPSQPKSGVDPSVTVDVPYIQSLLPAGLSWAFPYLPYMQGLVIGDVATFCSADPPTWTVPSATEILDFLTGGPTGAYLTVNQFLQDITRAYLWYALCECVSGTQPTPPTPPTAPTGAPVPNPPAITDPPGQPGATTPCFLGSDSVYSSVSSIDGVAQTLTTTSATAHEVHWGPYPTHDEFFQRNVNTIRLVTRRTQVGAGPHQNITWSIRWQSRTAFLFNQVVTHSPDGVDHVYDLIPPDGATNMILQYFVSATSTDTWRVHIEGYCNVPPGGTSTTTVCCPPDPTLLAMLTRLQQAVELIQRQAVPFSYVYGDNHAGLSGDGEISVQGLIGVSVDVTTLPASYGRASGTPERLFDVGFVTLGTDDGWSSTRRIDSDGALVLPGAAGVFTRVGYSLAPGVQVAIRELVREP